MQFLKRRTIPSRRRRTPVSPVSSVSTITEFRETTKEAEDDLRLSAEFLGSSSGAKTKGPRETRRTRNTIRRSTTALAVDGNKTDSQATLSVLLSLTSCVVPPSLTPDDAALSVALKSSPPLILRELLEKRLLPCTAGVGGKLLSLLLVERFFLLSAPYRAAVVAFRRFLLHL